MWDFMDLLPLFDASNIVALGEGGTPLLPSRKTWNTSVFWKNEAGNPTGSQKDRALSLAVSKAKELRVPRVIIASTGSAGLACAAYCARADIPCIILVPQGTPGERLLPIQILGGRVAEIAGTFVHIERILEAIQDHPMWYNATTNRASNPFHTEALKTISYEIFIQLGRAPEWVVVPVGGGSTLYGIWRGFLDLKGLGLIAQIPRMAAVQPARFNTLEVALQRGFHTQAELESIAADEKLDTIARNLKHGVPPDGFEALRAVTDSGGLAMSVTDREALDWQKYLGAREGLFCEPSSAVAAAAVDDMIKTGRAAASETIVAVITGSGLREIDSLEKMPPELLPATVNEFDLDRFFTFSAGERERE
jgi:threonine synthase